VRTIEAKLVTHSLEADIIEHPEKRPPSGSLFSAAREGSREGCKVDVKIKSDDEVFKVGEITLRLLLTPGHTPGGMCIYHEDSQAIFTGDLVLGQGYACYSVPMVRGDIETVVCSLEMLRELKVNWLLPGHGNVIHGEQAVSKQIKSHIMKLNRLPSRVLKILEERSSTTPEVSDKLLVWPQTVEKVFAWLEKEGKIQKIVERTTTTTERWGVT
jgi:glyoxylase-like metal-dependent hydrolase (beta-lactamase superfamily II)